MGVSVLDIAWAAGVYEGEGSFSGTHVIIAQKDPWILHKLTRIFKFGTITKHGSNGCHGWIISGENARGFLLTAFTFLSPRRKAEILKHKKFFIDPLFKRQTVCRNKHVKSKENTRKKWDYKRKDWNIICLDCQHDRSKKEWVQKSRQSKQGETIQ